MKITVELPDALAGQFQLGETMDLCALLQVLRQQRIVDGDLTVVSVVEAAKVSKRAACQTGNEWSEKVVPKAVRPQRDVMARLRGIYGDSSMTGANAVLVARNMERYGI